MPDDHSELVPLLPIPNRTVKRLSADDSAGSRVKVGHRQALTAKKAPTHRLGLFSWCKPKQKTKSAPSTTGRFFIGNSDKQAVLYLNEIGTP
jgi:hypothetical protein